MTTESEKLQEIARSALDSIRELVQNLRDADDDWTARDLAFDAIHSDPLSITVRDGWRELGQKSCEKEFQILLSTGGPATRIIGDIGDCDEPINCKIQAQDWFTPWETLYDISTEDQEILDEYCAQFCFYE